MLYKIAIISGGAAGMMPAYLLNKAGHLISVFRRRGYRIPGEIYNFQEYQASTWIKNLF